MSWKHASLSRSTRGVIARKLIDMSRHKPYAALPQDAERVEWPKLWRTRLRGDGKTPAVVALGKFDAMHVGHRALAATASKSGQPWLISFSGMAEVMGWDPTRLPLVAPGEKPLVLEMWNASCNGLTPRMRYIPFGEIRGLTPRQFLKVLVNDLGAVGVVAGSNYRFGYKAAGDASMLVSLAEEMGIKATIVDLVDSDERITRQPVSSSKVREALGQGDITSLHAFLGRPYVLRCATGHDRDTHQAVFYPKSTFLNQPPRNGTYSARIESRVMDVDFLDTGLVVSTSEGGPKTESVRIEFV